MTLSSAELFQLERLAAMHRAFDGPVSDLLCVLCHSRAWAWTSAIPTERFERHPACQWCAGTLYGFGFHNVHEARDYLRAELHRLHGKDMAVPLFSQAELDESGWALRTTFEASNQRRRFLLDLRHGLSRNRVPISQVVRAAVWERDGGRCTACGQPGSLHLDHIIPASIGGPSTIDNLRLLCANTNIRRGVRVDQLPQCLAVAEAAAS